MVSKEEFTAIHAGFIESQEFLDIVHHHGRGIDFVCHHNAYLVAGFLRRHGYECLQWTCGYYQCRDPEKRIRHSWIKLDRGGRIVAILELDPLQLNEAGGYENDLMPRGLIPESSMIFSGIASIVDPDVVELSQEAKESRWVVVSKEVLSRYTEDLDLVPQIDFAALDRLEIEASDEFDLLRELLDENVTE